MLNLSTGFKLPKAEIAVTQHFLLTCLLILTDTSDFSGFQFQRTFIRRRTEHGLYNPNSYTGNGYPGYPEGRRPYSLRPNGYR
jgi:hypothetical protein